MTGKRRFFEGMYPCVLVRVRKKEISEDLATQAEKVFREGTDPSVQLLENLFPVVVAGLKLFAACRNITAQNVWDFDTIGSFLEHRAKVMATTVTETV